MYGSITGDFPTKTADGASGRMKMLLSLTASAQVQRAWPSGPLWQYRSYTAFGVFETADRSHEHL
jgi:hypothetical protein